MSIYNDLNPYIPTIDLSQDTRKEKVDDLVSRLNIQTDIEILQLPIKILNEISKSTSGLPERRMKEYFNAFTQLLKGRGHAVTMDLNAVLTSESYTNTHKCTNVCSVGWMLKMLNEVLKDEKLASLVTRMTYKDKLIRDVARDARESLEEIFKSMIANSKSK